jgi:cytochrome P450
MAKALEDYNFFDEDTLECPFEFYKLAQDQAPIYHVPDTNTYIVTRYADVRAMLKDTETFSSNFNHLLTGPDEPPEVKALFEGATLPVDTLLTLDPPRHRVYRSLVNKVFSAKRVEAMHDYILQIVDELIDEMIDKGECEFIADFASPLPLLVIMDQLGIDRSMVAKAKEWSDALAARLGQMSDAEEQMYNARMFMEFHDFILGVIADRRAEPRDDMISDLVNIEIDDGRRLNNAEVMSITQQFMVAGNETTTSSLAGGLVSLIQNPQQFEAVLSDPQKLENMVEEVLRTESPSAGLWRVVTRDIEFNGVELPKDALVMLRYHAANRDEAVFEEPGQFDICRANADDHLAFGQGVHFCPGAMLARKEMNVAFDRLFARLTNFQLAPGKNDLTHWPNMMLRGLKCLHMTFEPREPSQS